MAGRGLRPWRIGAVNYLNSKPLIEGLTEQAPYADLVLDYPSRLADQLDRGELDVALIPSVEFLRNPDYEVISNACVAARGPVLSVKLYSRVPLGEIRHLALDEGSRTSAALTRIMLAERFGVVPHTETLPLGCDVRASTADAVLLIGDRAIPQPGEQFVATWDLGEEWLDWTGLPFVFAVWAGSPDTGFDELEAVLSAARDRGVARAVAIARREAPRLGIAEPTAIRYLTKHLHFRLGSAEQHGLRLFYDLATRLGLVPGGKELVFHNRTPA